MLPWGEGVRDPACVRIPRCRCFHGQLPRGSQHGRKHPLPAGEGRRDARIAGIEPSAGSQRRGGVRGFPRVPSPRVIGPSRVQDDPVLHAYPHVPRAGRPILHAYPPVPRAGRPRPACVPARPACRTTPSCMRTRPSRVQDDPVLHAYPPVPRAGRPRPACVPARPACRTTPSCVRTGPSRVRDDPSCVRTRPGQYRNLKPSFGKSKGRRWNERAVATGSRAVALHPLGGVRSLSECRRRAARLSSWPACRTSSARCGRRSP
jgi:hypothetical protein